jgi:hypothetical protein
MSALHSDDERTGSGSEPTDTAGTGRTERSPSRRAVLGAVGASVATALAGCTAGADPDGGTRSQDDTETLVDTTAEIPSPGHESFRFDLGSEQRVAVAAQLTDRNVDVKRDGPAVDVVVTTPAQFEQFLNGGKLAYVGGVSMPDVINGEVASTLGPGEYVLLADNTAAGQAEPGGTAPTAMVDLTVTATAEHDRGGPAGVQPGR